MQDVDAITAPSNARELVGSLPELGRPTGTQLDALLDEIEWLRVPAGERLFSEGELADGMYLLFEGRVRFLVEDHAGARVTWELDAVGVFGEGALLTGGGRSRTAVVVRDALLARLPPARFEELAATAPGVALAVARRVAHRTVVPDIGDEVTDRNNVRVALVAPALAPSRVRPVADVVTAEFPATTVVGPDDTANMAAAIRHSDRVLVVVDARSSFDLGPIQRQVRNGIDPLAAPSVELVLLHGRGQEPTDTARWLAHGDVSAHHHVRDSNADDLQRLARRIGGRAVGLVLSGGGARGMAHNGVVRALAELGIPVDHVGGSSMGAIVGGQAAFGWSWERMLEHNERVWTDRRLRLDFTLPTVSFFSGRRTRLIFDDTFGDADIADAPVPFFCTSVDLSAFRLAIQRNERLPQTVTIWLWNSATPGIRR